MSGLKTSGGVQRRATGFGGAAAGRAARTRGLGGAFTAFFTVFFTGSGGG
jgi:hypothetical protein